MIRMQTRTWNNVIIFVMLGMLVLFFVLNQKINTPEESAAQLLIPHEMQLVRWQNSKIDLQRNSQGRFVPTNTQQSTSLLSDTAINRLIGAWESAVINSIALSETQLAELDIAQAMHSLPVVLTTLDYTEPQLSRDITIQVVHLPQQTLLQLNTNYYVLRKPDGTYLIP